MAIEGWYANTVFILRWFHILFGIIWIGHLYFFNFVNIPFQGVLEKDLKPRVNPLLLPRALWWFRWGAMLTFLFGWTLLFVKYSGGDLWKDAATGMMSHRAMWILAGALFGSIMWFNVWFVIWPAQRQIIGWVKAAQAPPEMPALAKRAALFSKINTYLSAPMLFCMIAPNNYGSINAVTFIVVLAISMVIVAHLYKISTKVGTTI
ncbi:MAG: urate hydroxylase PuuD [Deltaproteobacteria bacterium]|nr:urate hydroxylase PuuD [Deltaproteobacteria bacterium]MBI3293669.1 urate hydroxylase PuuD [Deltaproteobacteria bacterium]